MLLRFICGLFAVYLRFICGLKFRSLPKNTNVSLCCNLCKTAVYNIFRGKRGIRTPVTLLASTRFPGVPLKPLEHLSLTITTWHAVVACHGCYFKKVIPLGFKPKTFRTGI